MAWNNINSTQKIQLRSTFQQTEQGLLYVAPKYRYGSRAADGSVTYEDVGMSGLAIRRFELQARAAQTAVGVGFRWANKHWMAGQWTEAGSVYTDDTADAQDTGADDFALETLTANSGFIILSQRPFGWVSINVTTANAGTAPVHAASYSNFAGTGWTDVGTAAPYETLDADAWATGEIRFVWTPAADWGKVVSIGSVPNGYYALRFRATTAAGTTAALAGSIEIGTFYGIDTLGDNGIWEEEHTQYYDPYADAVISYWSAANDGNRVLVEVTTA